MIRAGRSGSALCGRVAGRKGDQLTHGVGVLLNRDDNNLAKRLCKDGLEFTRVSSQCLRYNLRKADCEY